MILCRINCLEFFSFLLVDYGDKVRKRLKEGVSPAPRREIVKNDNVIESNVSRFVHSSFMEIFSRVKNLKFSSWDVNFKENRIIFCKSDELFLISKFQVIVDDSLGFAVSIYGWYLPEDYPLYTLNKPSVRNITVSQLLKDLET